MVIKVLVENMSISEDLGSEHGLSLYIEANGRKILFDTGASEMYLENAKKMDVDISAVELLVISHGHYDHGGGLNSFLSQNDKAEMFLSTEAFETFYYSLHPGDDLRYIGIDQKLKDNDRISFVSDYLLIGEGLEIFSNVAQTEALPRPNKGIFIEKDGQLLPDIFAHEQNLIIEEGGKSVLLTGCAHNGIVNIVEHFRSIKGCMPDYVIGGFHLAGNSPDEDEYAETIDKIAEYLLATGAKCYTGHCTGMRPYKKLKALMGDRLEYLATGSEIRI
ncbi:MAG: MBL fold metallo-hydrolase [Clostridiales bacterium]|nr:MBL fold metallo-hydrolase [Clostridiales bacterium]